MLTDEQRTRLRTLYVDQKMSCAAIGREIGVDAKTVQRWLIEAGIPRRTASEAAEIAWGAKNKL